MRTSGILHSLSSGKKSVRQLLLFLLLCLMLAVLPGKVMAQPQIDLSGISYTNATAVDTTGEVWNSGAISNVCSGNYTIEYTLGGPGDPKFLQYQVNSGGWNTLGASPATVNAGSSSLELRLMVTALHPAEIVTMNILVYEPFTVSLVSATTHDITCNGANNGAITVIGQCGRAAPTSYHWTEWGTFTDPGTAAISPLVAGTYEVTVRNGVDADVVLSHVINEPSALAYTYTVKNWSCTVCDGSIHTHVTAGTGTLPYNVNVSGGAYNVTTSNADTIFGGLCAGDYTILVTDANSCPTTPVSVDTTITLDNILPTCTTYPPTYLMDIGAGSPPSGTLETFVDNSYGYTGGDLVSDTIVFQVDAQSHSNIFLEVVASQSLGADWEANDFLKVSFSDGGAYQQVVLDYCQWNGAVNESPGAIPCNGNTVATSTDWQNLPGTDGKVINVQIVFSSESPHDYTISHLRVRGNKFSSGITPSVSGSPEDCSDEHGPVTFSYTDGSINWYCNEPGNQEFWFMRHWMIHDFCVNERTYDQRIVVGTSPVITAPTPIIRDFCYNLDVDIAAPVVTDDCGKLTISWTITDNESTTILGSGLDSIIDFDFPQPVYNDSIYTITWTAVDTAGFSATVDQTLTFKHQMHISLVPLLPADGQFCTGNSASFTISVVGGTESYQPLVPLTTITPNGTWSSAGDNSTGTFTTTNLTNLTPGTSNVITVNYYDATFNGVTGGCQTYNVPFNSGGFFTVHDKISTLPLSRD